MGYYQNLLGKEQPHIKEFDSSVMERGRTVSELEAAGLCMSFTKEDVHDALKGIDDIKAPGLDGFSAGFFKEAWPLIHEEAVLNFFSSGKLLGGASKRNHHHPYSQGILPKISGIFQAYLLL